MSSSNDSAPPRSTEIHGLRGVLAISLYVFHVVNSGLPTFEGATATYLHQFLSSLEHGVELFFCISGIVIVGAYRKSANTWIFIWDRISRIMPVLWVTVLIITALSIFEPQKKIPLDPVTLLANLAALPPMFSFKLIHPAAWSISYEFAFYSLFVLASLLRLKFSTRFAISVSIAIGAVLVATHLRGASFAIGVALAAGWGASSCRWPGVRFSGVWLLCALLLWQLSFASVDSASARLYRIDQFLDQPLAALLFMLAQLCSWFGMAGVLAGRGFFSALLRSPLAQWLGTISFSLYLWQTITMALVKKGIVVSGLTSLVGEWSQVVFFLVALPPTLLISSLSQQWLEVRVTKWLRRGRTSTTPVASPAEVGNHR